MRHNIKQLTSCVVLFLPEKHAMTQLSVWISRGRIQRMNGWVKWREDGWLDGLRKWEWMDNWVKSKMDQWAKKRQIDDFSMEWVGVREERMNVIGPHGRQKNGWSDWAEDERMNVIGPHGRQKNGWSDWAEDECRGWLVEDRLMDLVDLVLLFLFLFSLIIHCHDFVHHIFNF